MNSNILIVPGFGGSGPAHWQSWFERRLPGSQRLEGVDWNAPVLAEWARKLRHQVQRTPERVWLVAHSFGCLVSAVVIADIPDRVAGALFVAPADPERFTLMGRRDGDSSVPSIASLLPQSTLGIPGLLVGSSDDPWMSEAKASEWAQRWGLAMLSVGAAKHINTESGYGEWQQGLRLLQLMLQAAPQSAGGAVAPRRHAGRGGALARVRLETRRQLGL